MGKPTKSDQKRYVGENLRLAREALGLNQSDIAKLAGISQGAVSQYERGTRLLDGLTAARIKRRFKISCDWLFDRDLGALPRDLAEKIEALMNAPTTPNNERSALKGHHRKKAA